MEEPQTVIHGFEDNSLELHPRMGKHGKHIRPEMDRFAELIQPMEVSQERCFVVVGRYNLQSVIRGSFRKLGYDCTVRSERVQGQPYTWRFRFWRIK